MKPTTSLLMRYQTISRWPFGDWLFSQLICLKAPYFGSIAPRIQHLEYGRCEATMQDRRAVRNHIGSIHAIALCNLAELCAGIMSDASMPSTMRWIPKGMQVAYLQRASGSMRAVATPTIPIISSSVAYDLPVRVVIFNQSDSPVFQADIQMWVSPKK